MIVDGLRRRAAARFLPLTPARLQVLVALAESDKHGYAILKDVARLSSGSVRLSASTLYSVLDRLEEDGLIEESGARPAPELDDERRRYYRLTKLGGEVVRLEAQRLDEIVRTAKARFGSSKA